MEKTCSICKVSKPATSEFFASRYDRKTPRLQGVCRVCQKEYRRTHYVANKQKYIEKSKLYKENFLQWYEGLKQTLRCQSCGESRWWVLDFHHTNPNEKDDDIADLVRLCNKKKVLEEISKCQVLCSNCHRDLHYQLKQAG